MCKVGVCGWELGDARSKRASNEATEDSTSEGALQPFVLHLNHRETDCRMGCREMQSQQNQHLELERQSVEFSRQTLYIFIYIF